MTDYEYDPDLPYVVEPTMMGHARARFATRGDADEFAKAHVCRVIDTTPKPRVPEDAKYVTWRGESGARWYAERRDGMWVSDNEAEVEDIDHFPSVTPDTVFTVLEERKNDD